MSSFTESESQTNVAATATNKDLHHEKNAHETRTGTEGTAKRNIVRKNHKGGGGNVGKANGKSIDDGSTYKDPAALDAEDPNFDSEEDTGKEYVRAGSFERHQYHPETRTSVTQAPMTLTNFKRKLEAIFEELFQSDDILETQKSISEIYCPQYAYELVKRAISMALDRGDKEREIVSRFISESYPDLLSTNTIGKGFERLFELADELEKDVPAAKEYIATFVARCVVDEVLPPAFLSDIVVCDLGGEIVERAKRMLSREHGHALLARGWGPGDGRPVEDLKVAVDLIMQEFLLSGDKVEADRCIHELNSAYFHHEIIKRGVTISLEKTEDERESMKELFFYLFSNETVSQAQFVQGFNRLFSVVNDLSLDIPNAIVYITAFKERALAYGILPPDYIPKFENEL